MRTALSLVGWVLLLAYPAAVYYGLTRFESRQVVWVLLPAVVITALVRIPAQRRAAYRDALKIPAGMAALLLLAALFDDRRFMLAMPVLISVVLLIGFAGSLFSEMPIVERFARAQVDTLSPAEVVYCRQVTIAWCVFFVVNGSLAGWLALRGTLSSWALYTGVLAYVLIGIMAATEYVIRKVRFGRFGRTPIDRLLQAALAKRPIGR
jgi:uncharacterized membrane protein